MIPGLLLAMLPKGEYEDIKTIGAGALGGVYRARRVSTGDDVVLKIVPLLSDIAAKRYQRETTLLLNLGGCENLVSYLDSHVSESPRGAILVMEWVKGASLQRLIARHGALEEAVLVAVGRQLATGLGHLHDHGILHRDIKPSNALVRWDGLLKLSDFGLATLAEPEDDDITTEGTVPGTIRYMAPELMMGRSASVRSDLYSLGVTLLTAALGRPPFDESEHHGLIGAIMTGEMPKVVPENLGAKMQELLRDLVSSKPAERPESAQVVLSRLLEIDKGSEAADRKLLSELIDSGEEGADASAMEPPRPLVDTSAAKNDASVLSMVTQLAGQVAQIEAGVRDLTSIVSIKEISRTAAAKKGDETSLTSLDDTFGAIRRRLGYMWRVALIMTLTLFSVFLGMLALAVVLTVMYREPAWALVFGGGSAASVVGVVLWRPMDKMLFATIVTQQLEMIQLNYYRALSGSHAERREAYRDVSRQLDALLAKMLAGQKATRSRGVTKDE